MNNIFENAFFGKAHKTPYIIPLTPQQQTLVNDGDMYIVENCNLVFVCKALPEPKIKHWYDRLIFWR